MTSGTNMRGKLVRDRIPEIILQAGLTPVIETASPEDYGRYVRAKLEEELEEYLSSGDVAEVATSSRSASPLRRCTVLVRTSCWQSPETNDSGVVASIVGSCGWGTCRATTSRQRGREEFWATVHGRSS
jgi:hypothetical protein